MPGRAAGKYLFQIEPQLSRIHDDGELEVLTISRHARLFAVVGPRFSGKSSVCQALARSQNVVLVEAEVCTPRQGLFRLTARRLATRRSRASDQAPLVFVDGLHTLEQAEELSGFFLPRPRFIVLDVSPCERLRRARQLDPEGWSRRILHEKDRPSTDFLRDLETWLAPYKDELLLRIPVGSSLRQVVREIRKWCGLELEG